MIFFETHSGSRYEVDEVARLIRRVRGEHAPRSRQGQDGEWKPYEDLSPIELGSRVLISWPVSVPLLEGSPTGATPATITGLVVCCGVRT